ncbi:hypothetical protein [Nocardioides sp. SYSU D00038]|uniref:hypothetical protein n=1 Tax=Nocardioides sp. SYSU D00038 TaxID=2812554 RepID=UPI0019687D3D|nr:hypothetical protein [Nocardioides sp. SYSU D00038]
MRLSRGPLALLLGTLLVVAVGCGGDDVADDPVGAEPSSSTPDDATCRELVGEAVVEALGWAGVPAATEHAGRCERVSPDHGSVTVRSEALVDPVDDVLAAACTGLREAGGTVAEPEPLAGTDRSCSSRYAGDTGVATLYYVNDGDRVVQLRVAAHAPTDQNALGAGLAALVTTTRGWDVEAAG